MAAGKQWGNVLPAKANYVVTTSCTGEVTAFGQF
jgi:hypothetical protein